MEFVTLSKENLAREHICCAISRESDCQVSSKKAWLNARFTDGLVFTKGNVRGKCFIEYIPAERAWAPIDAPGYMYINCLWVSGQFAGQGNADALLASCVADSTEKGKKGLVILSAERKLPFLADPAFLKHKGFLPADRAEPNFVLYYLPFDAAGFDSDKPSFLPHLKSSGLPTETTVAVGEPFTGMSSTQNAAAETVSALPETSVSAPACTGFTVYYSHQCPFPAKYVPILEETARKLGVPFTAVRFETAEQARRSPSPCTSFSLFHDGRFITNEIPSAAKFEKLAVSLNAVRGADRADC